MRWRDGDACRYCGKVVNWADRKGGKGGVYDHVCPASRTWHSEVVACRSCNSIRGNASKGLPPRREWRRPIVSGRCWILRTARTTRLGPVRAQQPRRRPGASRCARPVSLRRDQPLRAGSERADVLADRRRSRAGSQPPRPGPVSTSSLPGSQPDQAISSPAPRTCRQPVGPRWSG